MRLGEIAIAVVHAGRLFRAGLACLLSHEATFPIAEIDDVRQLAARTTTQKFDLVVLQGQGKDGAELEAVRRTRMLLPGARIAVLAEKFDTDELRQCFLEGADGYLLKDIGRETLYASLELIMSGEKILPGPFADILLHERNLASACPQGSEHVQDGTFSEREVDILRCLAEGSSNKQIALRLNIAEATVKVHLKSILRKTHSTNRTQAAIWAIQRGLSGMAATPTMPSAANGCLVEMAHARSSIIAKNGGETA